MFFNKNDKVHTVGVVSGQEVNFKEFCSDVSKESGCKVWTEQDGGKVLIITDGNPNIVKKVMSDVACKYLLADLVAYWIYDAMMENRALLN